MAGRADLVRLHGEDPIAFSTLQTGLLYCDTSYGYIAYQRAWGIDITLGPPVAAACDHAALYERFLRLHRRPVFCYLRAQSAQQVLLAGTGPAERRLHVAGMGVDRLLKTRSLGSAAASLPKPLLGARKHARRAGFFLQAVNAEQLSLSLLLRLSQITHAYLQKSQLPYEMRFLNRPFALRDAQPQTTCSRLYLLWQTWRRDEDPQLFGYAVLNPWFREGAVAGYLLDILRCEPTRQWGVFYAVVDALCRELQQQGIDELSLGFCPLHQTQGSAIGGSEEPTLSGSSLLAAQLDWLEKHLSAVPYVQRLRELKTSLPGVSCPRYFVSFSALALPAFVALMGACGVRLRSLVGASLWQSIRAAHSA